MKAHSVTLSGKYEFLMGFHEDEKFLCSQRTVYLMVEFQVVEEMFGVLENSSFT